MRAFAGEKPARIEGARPRCNILGPTSLGFRHRDDVIEVRNIITSLGIDVNVTAPLGASPEDLQRLGNAEFNVVLYPEVAGVAASFLARKYGQKNVTTVPIGVAATRRFINELAELAGVDPAPALDDPSSRLPWYSRSVDANYLTGKRVFVFGDATHAIAAAEMAATELGFTVVGLGTYSREFARDVREAAARHGVEALISDDYLEIEKAIADSEPELVLGTQMERHIAKRLKVPCAVISAPIHVQDFPARRAPQMGFEGRQRDLRHLGRAADDGPGGTFARHVPRGFRIPRGRRPLASWCRRPGSARARPPPTPNPPPWSCNGRPKPKRNSAKSRSSCAARPAATPRISLHSKASPPSLSRRCTRQRPIMHVSQVHGATPVRMVVVTMDSHMSSALLAAEAQVRRDVPGLELALHTADDWASNADDLKTCVEDISRADIVLVSMLFLDEHIRAVLPALTARRDHCDAMVCLMSRRRSRETDARRQIRHVGAGQRHRRPAETPARLQAER